MNHIESIIEKLDETGECFLSSFWVSLCDITDKHSQMIYDILSLQKNGLCLTQSGRWKIVNSQTKTKKHWGYLHLWNLQSKYPELLK